MTTSNEKPKFYTRKSIDSQYVSTLIYKGRNYEKEGYCELKSIYMLADHLKTISTIPRDLLDTIESLRFDPSLIDNKTRYEEQ